MVETSHKYWEMQKISENLCKSHHVPFCHCNLSRKAFRKCEVLLELKSRLTFYSAFNHIRITTALWGEGGICCNAALIALAFVWRLLRDTTIFAFDAALT